MRKLLFSAISSGLCLSAAAQTIDFETLALPKADTFYVNYSAPGQDVGFDVGSVHFQCDYDTAFGGMWNSGFAYSNMTDSATSGFMNQYSAKPAKGYNNSGNYAVYWNGYGNYKRITLPDGAITPTVKTFTGFYVTNSTFAYNSMRDGDAFSRKFGDTTGTGSGLPQGNYPDWFKLTVKAYDSGVLKDDSVDFYLADFRDNNDANDYIVGDWQWVNLAPLGTMVDSLEFILTSSDVGQFGMNTPAYFCMDNLTPLIATSTKNVSSFAAKIYPNPAVNSINIETNADVKTISVFDLSGKLIAVYNVTDKTTVISTSDLSPGSYLLQISNGTQKASHRFIKQ